MMPFDDFPPDLDTPFYDMLAYLLRATSGGERGDYDYIRAVSKTFERFGDLPYADMVDVIALCIRYHYFDRPLSRMVPLSEGGFAARSDEFLSMGDLLDGVARANGIGCDQANGLGGEANDLGGEANGLGGQADG